MIGFAGLNLQKDAAVPTWCPTWTSEQYLLHLRHESGEGSVYEWPDRSIAPSDMVVFADDSNLAVQGLVLDRVVAVMPETDHTLSRSFDAKKSFTLASRVRQTHSTRADLTLSQTMDILRREHGAGSAAAAKDVFLRLLFAPLDAFSHVLEGSLLLGPFLRRNSWLTTAAEIYHVGVTERGYVGFVPEVTEIGDCVAMVRDICWLSVLRPLRKPVVGEGERGSRVQLLGDSHFLDLGREMVDGREAELRLHEILIG
jgi:hypothetical protein